MAFKISYRFLAKDNFSVVTKKIRAGNKKLGNSFKRLGTKMKQSDRQFKTSSQSMASNIKKLAIAALAFMGFNKLIETANEFEDAMADLSAITGAVGKDLDLLRDKTFEMAKASITSQVDVAKGIKLVASAKPELLKNLPALAATTEAVLLLKNTGIDLEAAVAATVGGLNAFGEGAEFAARNVNILAAGSQLGSSEVSETAEALKLAGPGAKAAGLTFLDLNVAIQALAKSSIKGSQAGTALNAMMARLRLSGLDFREIGLAGAFKEVKKQLEAIKDPTERATAEFELFGLEHAKSGLAMLDNIPVIDELTRTMQGTDSATQQASIRMSTFSNKMKLIGILLDEKIIKTMGFAREGTNFLASAVKDFVEGLDPADIESFGIILSGLGTIVAGLVKIFSVAFTVIMGVVKPVLSTLKGIADIIGQITAAVATLDFEGLKNTFSVDSLKESFSIGGKFLGVFGDEESPKIPVNKVSANSPISSGGKSVTDINMNINAPEGVVKSIQSKTSGRAANVGVNMAAG